MRGPRASAIYCRISEDRKGDRLGVERQERLARRLAADRGWKVAEVYVDNDLTAARKAGGRLPERPGFDRLRSAIEARRVDGVLAYDLDRLLRDPLEAEQFWLLCEQTGMTRILTIADDVDISTGHGILVARIKAAVAAEEVRKLRQRVIDKKDELAERGLPSGGGRRPYGWLPDRMSHDVAEAANIRRAADVILAGGTLQAACDAVPDIDDPTVLRRVLVSPRTAGLRQHRGEVVGDAAWPPILDRDTWTEVRSMLDSRRRFVRPFRKHLLSGIARCGNEGCGARLYAQVSSRHGEQGPVVYTCRAARGGCNALAIRAARLEPVVLDTVGAWLRDPRFAAAVTEVLNGGRADDDTTTLDAAVKADEARLAELAVEREEHGLELVEWRAMRAPVLARLEANRAALADARQRRAVASPLADATPAELAELWASDVLGPDARRALISLLAAEVTVLPAGRGWRSQSASRVRVRPVWD